MNKYEPGPFDLLSNSLPAEPSRPECNPLGFGVLISGCALPSGASAIRSAMHVLIGFFCFFVVRRHFNA
jgi:hypothetical protein